MYTFNCHKVKKKEEQEDKTRKTHLSIARVKACVVYWAWSSVIKCKMKSTSLRYPVSWAQNQDKSWRPELMHWKLRKTTPGFPTERSFIQSHSIVYILCTLLLTIWECHMPKGSALNLKHTFPGVASSFLIEETMLFRNPNPYIWEESIGYITRNEHVRDVETDCSYQELGTNCMNIERFHNKEGLFTTI